MSRITPPELPQRRLDKVLGVSRANSIGVLGCAGASLLLNLLAQDWIMAGFAALAVVAGAMEWHGQTRLRDSDLGGLHWLLGAQGCLYTVIAGYVMWRLQHFDPAALWAELPDDARERFLEQLRQADVPESDRDTFLRAMNLLICAVLLVVSTLYQGGLSWWYRRNRGAIAAALDGS
jgi:hypothetical protein